GGNGHAQLDGGRVEDGLRDDQRGRGHADGRRRREPGDRVGGSVHGHWDIADRGGDRGRDDHRDGQGWVRQPDPGRDGGAGGDGDGEHGHPAQRDSGRERRDDGYVELDRGRVEDGPRSLHDALRNADGRRRREPGDRVGGSVHGHGHIADRGGHRDRDDHRDGEGWVRKRDRGRPGGPGRDGDR